ncbi:nuclear transport factor 2 family protein [Pseudoalteromonas luteoviolacea]|uniref:SnoaL-like domain-containing protein n=1 Tax=Pseudoalteromonas luteoviolacea S4054 TaxID=1129367 RepID=A0A0F6A8Q4_9GAMM|nr:nuclear transport factor 2 family protein [Pseudoalteromonas luteoviolacea]AOT08662.1 hypothetical protein S4054249_12710 [Pseudoalteromonas luteoviolacea]AOT13577.1 hypothetical protein S40542_12685 [Pseudoalteromonas luteoviolacea]AOT18490.1 hypothetical protein S4054_12685 [Pseudoalteromonas luteoviolacea]KKE82508.1 hypothetical protein N479_18040 [Pseudoalteromonas luteoviolacea S4054]KZN72045.1 hypothetical protein N481_16675 [Pseudoalteromonas luteoviolacea S4047-1]
MKLLSFVSVLLLSACSTVKIDKSEPITVGAEQENFKTTNVEAHQVIDDHLVAYNSNDYASFKALFHEEIEVYDFPNNLSFKGMKALDKVYKSLVEDLDKKAFISERIIDGNFVVDKEAVKFHMTGRGEQSLEVLVIYQLKDDLIYRVMFLRDE